MSLQVNQIILSQKLEEWPEKLLQSDTSGKNLMRVYRLLCEIDEGTKLLSQFINKIQSVALLQRHLNAEKVYQTRSDTTLLDLLRKRLCRKKASDFLPAEIWGKIASHFVEEDEKSLLAMTHTCQTFRSSVFARQIVLQNPWLLLDVRTVIKENKPLIPASFTLGPYTILKEALFANLFVLYLSSFHELPVHSNYLKKLATTFCHVQKLDLSSSHLTQKHFAKLSHFKDLKELDLNFCTFPSDALSLLPDTLTFLDLSSCKLQDSDLLGISHLKNLTELDLNNNELTGAAFQALFPLVKLTSLHISNNSAITGDDLSGLPQSVRYLRCNGDLSQAAVKLATLRTEEEPQCSIM